MTPDETRAFLLEGTRTAALATVRAKGRLHVAPIWFTLDGDDLLFTSGKNMRSQHDALLGYPDRCSLYGRRSGRRLRQPQRRPRRASRAGASDQDRGRQMRLGLDESNGQPAYARPCRL